VSFSRILCATDLSERAGLAVNRAVQLAAQTGAALEVLHVIEEADHPFGRLWQGAGNQTDFMAALKQSAFKRLTAQVCEADKPWNVTPEMTVRIGRVMDAIIEHCAATGADLVVIGAHGKQVLRDLMLGTTAENLMRHGNRPTLIVRQTAAEAYQRALVAVDFSEDARAALAFTARLLPHAQILVMHVIDITPFDDMREAGMGERDVDRYYSEEYATVARLLPEFIHGAGLDPDKITTEIVTGYPSTTVADVAKVKKTELVLMGTHGRSPLGRLLLGTVAGRLVHEVECDAMVVRSASVASN